MHLLELILLTIYIVLGPDIWGIYCWTMVLGRRRLMLMKRNPIKGEPPTVTILIPAKDEGERIRACVLSALGQDYPSFDVITIDEMKSWLASKGLKCS